MSFSFRSTQRKRHVLPGFGLSLGFTLTYLSFIVLIPLAGVFFKSYGLGWEGFWHAISNPRALASYRITFGASLIAALINVFFGVMTSWVLVRYEFPGKRIVDGLVDLPFALPTAVAGIALTSLYAEKGWIGWFFSPEGLLGPFFGEKGLKIAYTELGIIIALTFIGLPFVVRTIQPVLADLQRDVEEAAAVLGASRWQTLTRVILPELYPALLTGFALAFARALGEYGSVVFIAGNMPMKTEITPLLIIIQLEQYHYAEAAALAVAMLFASFLIIFVINLIQWWSAKFQLNGS
jgi:sulfate/thiosulfate transport system permease protein